MAQDTNNDMIDSDIEMDTKKKSQSFAQESILELVEIEEGKMVLRDINDHDDPLVTIAFSKKVKDILDNDTQAIGQHMIHSAIQLVMHKQISNWHANVYDEEPEHYS